MFTTESGMSLSAANDWRWTAGRPVKVEKGEDSTHLTISGKGAEHLTLIYDFAPDGEPLRVRITAPEITNLVVNIDPTQSHAVIESVTIEGVFRSVRVACPVWVGDPTELGTAEIGHLTVNEADQLFLGGDELYIDRLSFLSTPSAGPEASRDDAWDRVVVSADSRVYLGTAVRGGVLALAMEDRSYIEVESSTAIYLGALGVDAEICGTAQHVVIEDWKTHLCGGNEHLKLTGIHPFGYGVLRGLTRRLHDTSPMLLASYCPRHADRLPLDLSTSTATRGDWVRRHAALIDEYCDDPAVSADARWLTYDHRRGLSTPGSVQWLVLHALRGLGYGLKVKPPAIAWLSVTVAVALLYGIQNGLHLNPLGGFSPWWRMLVLVVEAALLPAGIFSLADSPDNSVLLIHGTALRLARLACSVPFAAIIFAVQARVRLPKFSDAKL